MTTPAASAAPAQKREFSWTDDTAAALIAAFASQPEKLARMKARIAETQSTEAKLQSLRTRKAALLQRNRTLRHKAGLPPVPEEQAEEEDEKSVTVACASPPPSSPPLSSANPTTSTASSNGHKSSVAGLSSSSSAAAMDEFGESTVNKRAPAVPSDWGSKVSLYQYKGPSLKGGVVSAVFEDGLLYRVITERGDWAFYNDSRFYEMHVHYVFHGSSKVNAGSRCLLSKLPSGAWEAKMTLAPEQTQVLVSGTVVDFENKSQAVLVSRTTKNVGSANADDAAAAAELYATQRAELAAIQEAVTATASPCAGSEEGGEERVAQLCAEKQLPFVDATFFPDQAALCRESDTFFIPPLRWSRPRDYLPADAAQEVRLFRDSEMHPWDLVHSHVIPDSGFVSAVGLLTESPQLVRRLFRHPQGAAVALTEHAVGLYRVQLCRGGLWRTIIVDDYVPSKAHCPELAHVKSDLRRIWLPLLEKAYAKACGSFSAVLDSPAEVVAQEMSGVPVASLASLWPTATASAQPATSPLDTFIEAFYLQSRGRVLLKTFSLATARTQVMRDRLAQSYHSLGLTAGVAVVILGVEKCAGHTLVRLRQTLSADSPPRRIPGTATATALTAKAAQQEADSDWLQVWLDDKKPWAPALADVLMSRNQQDADEAHVLYMDVKDLPQYFQEGWAFFSGTRFGELRLSGASAFANGCPSHCLAIEVSAPATLMVTLTQVKSSPTSRRQSGAQASKRRSSDDGGERNSSIGSLSAFGSVDAIGLQVLSTTAQTGRHTLGLAQVSRGKPDMFALPASGDAVTYEFTGSVSVGLTLIPEMSPYFVVPRIQSHTATTPYTLAAFVEKGADTRISVSAVSSTCIARVLSATTVPVGIPSPNIAQSLSPIPIQYRWCSSDVLSETVLSTLTW